MRKRQLSLRLTLLFNAGRWWCCCRCTTRLYLTLFLLALNPISTNRSQSLVLVCASRGKISGEEMRTNDNLLSNCRTNVCLGLFGVSLLNDGCRGERKQNKKKTKCKYNLRSANRFLRLRGWWKWIGFLYASIRTNASSADVCAIYFKNHTNRVKCTHKTKCALNHTINLPFFLFPQISWNSSQMVRRSSSPGFLPFRSICLLQIFWLIYVISSIGTDGY